MKIVRTVADLRRLLESARGAGRSVALVPTMGAFHEGHLSLMRRARADCDLVVVSLFVNPAQFGPGEDLERYPGDERRDAGLAAAEGVNVLFAPSFDEVYPSGFSTSVEVAGLGETLCGDPTRRGPSHFRGVATVVAKLLNMCSPDVAYFGAKDFQQTVVIRRLVRDLDIPVRIEVCPIVRDADGLALSSRNAYLSPAERRSALALRNALTAAERAAVEGALPADLESAARAVLESEPGVEPEYVEVVSAHDLSPLEALTGEVLVAVAARVGSTRLIDNTTFQVKASAVATPATAGTGPGE